MDRSRHQTTKTDPGYQYFDTASCRGFLGTFERNFDEVPSINIVRVTMGAHFSLFRIYGHSNGPDHPMKSPNSTYNARDFWI